MYKLEKSLKEWTALGLLDQEQANKIRQHEADKSGGWVLSGILTLGIIAIFIGVVSLIAANWQQIPDLIKLSCDFILLILLGIGVWYAQKNQGELLFEILLLAFMLLCLASIGLISQIYQTGGELYQALMLWSIITVGLVFLSKRLFTPLIWIGGFIIALAFTASNSPLFWPVFGDNGYAIAMCMPLFCWCMALVTHHRLSSENITKSFEIWTIITGLFGMLMVELNTSGLSSHSLIPYLPGVCLASLALLGTWLITPFRCLQKILLTAALVMFILLFTLPIMKAADLVFAIVALLILTFMAFFFASLKRRSLFQFFLILIGIRLLVLYFQALGGLARTGIGLVIAGALIVAMVVLWSKYRTRLVIRIERWTQS